MIDVVNTPIRVLLVDDEEILRSFLQECLTFTGQLVVGVDSGEEALVRLKAEDFDIVITDDRMPGMTGLQLAAVIKASRPSLPVIMLTGYVPQAQTSCVDLVLRKPSDIPNLATSVRVILDRAKA